MTAYNDVPELIEPIAVTITQINKATTPYSSGVTGRRETLNHVVRNPEVIVEAQVAFGDSDQKPEYSQLGVDEVVKGHLTLRYQDIENLGITLQRGDKITKMGGKNVEYFLLHGNGDPAAHFSSIGFTLVRMFFSDKSPVK